MSLSIVTKFILIIFVISAWLLPVTFPIIKSWIKHQLANQMMNPTLPAIPDLPYSAPLPVYGIPYLNYNNKVMAPDDHGGQHSDKWPPSKPAPHPHKCKMYKHVITEGIGKFKKKIIKCCNEPFEHYYEDEETGLIVFATSFKGLSSSENEPASAMASMVAAFAAKLNLHSGYANGADIWADCTIGGCTNSKWKVPQSNSDEQTAIITSVSGNYRCDAQCEECILNYVCNGQIDQVGKCPKPSHKCTECADANQFANITNNCICEACTDCRFYMAGAHHARIHPCTLKECKGSQDTVCSAYDCTLTCNGTVWATGGGFDLSRCDGGDPFIIEPGQ